MRKSQIALTLVALFGIGMFAGCHKEEIPDHRLSEPILMETFLHGLYDYDTMVKMLDQIHYVRGFGNTDIDSLVVDSMGIDRTEEFIRETKSHMRRKDYLGMLSYCKEHELRVFRKGDFIVTNMTLIIEGIPSKEFIVLNADGTHVSTEFFLNQNREYYETYDYSSILEYIDAHGLLIVHHRKSPQNLDL